MAPTAGPRSGKSSVSKLFNTLEKIRHHEKSGEPGRRSVARKPVATGKSGPPRFLSLLLVAMLAMVVLYTVLLSSRLNLTPLTANLRQMLVTLHLLPGSEGQRPTAPQPSAPGAQGVQPGQVPTSAVAEAAQLTKTGLEQFRGGDPWRAIYSFDRARQRDPQAVEPLVNMAVVLCELGLYGPANRIFREASALAPNDPALRHNLAILAEAGRLDDALQARLGRNQAVPQRGR